MKMIFIFYYQIYRNIITLVFILILTAIFRIYTIANILINKTEYFKAYKAMVYGVLCAYLIITGMVLIDKG